MSLRRVDESMRLRVATNVKTKKIVRLQDVTLPEVSLKDGDVAFPKGQNILRSTREAYASRGGA